ncbi:hypothetical protein RZN25_03005 [Bacillaceae bacterium S4-13-56]
MQNENSIWSFTAEDFSNNNKKHMIPPLDFLCRINSDTIRKLGIRQAFVENALVALMQIGKFYTFLSVKKNANALRNKKSTCFCEVALSSYPLCDYSGQKLRRLLDEAFSLELDKFS